MSQELQIRERADDGTIQGARGLTKQQQALVISFAALGSVSAAAQEVGCRADQAGRTLRLPHVQEALLGECRSLLARAAPVAIECLTSIAGDKDAPLRVRLDASKALLDRAGFLPQKREEGPQGGKRDLSDLSMAELAAFIQQGQRQASAVDTEGTVTTPDTD